MRENARNFQLKYNGDSGNFFPEVAPEILSSPSSRESCVNKFKDHGHL